MKAVQKEAVARQVKLDEESLQRLKEAEAKDKVHCESLVFLLQKTGRKKPLGVITGAFETNSSIGFGAVRAWHSLASLASFGRCSMNAHSVCGWIRWCVCSHVFCTHVWAVALTRVVTRLV